MSDRPRLLVLNPTCLEVAGKHRTFAESRGIEMLADPAYASLDEAGAAALLASVDAVILPAAVRGFPSEQTMRECPRLLACSVAASGYEWFDTDAATRSGIIVAYAPGGEGAEVVADLAWGLMLAAARQIPFRHHRLAGGDTTRGMGTSVFGKTLGVVGFGHIGRAVARRAAGFRVNVVVNDPAIDANDPALQESGARLLPLDELLAVADFVSLHVRLCESTRAMIGAVQLARMKPTAFLINTARRELVDEAALIAALVEGRIAGAGLDDPAANPAAAAVLFEHPGVVFTPHIGNRAIEGVTGVFLAAVENAAAVLRGERPAHVANPEVYGTPALAKRSRKWRT